MRQLDIDGLRRTILVVEDDPTIREMVARIFDAKGYTVLEADRGEAALGLLAAEPVGVLLLDKNLPGEMNGLEVLRLANESAPHIKSIIMTAYPSTDSAVEALRLGAFDYLRKPFKLDEIVEKVERAVATLVLDLEEHAILQHHNTLFETIPGMVWFANDEGRFERINRLGAGLLGYDPEDVVGRSYESLLVDAGDPAVHWAFKERRTGERSTRRLLVELKTAHGGKRMFEMFSSGVYLTARVGDRSLKRYWGTMGVAFDVTEVRMQQEVQQAQKLEAIGRLAGGVAHDLNNNLSVILTNAVLLQEALPESDANQTEIRDIIGSARKGAALTRNLLGFARKGETVKQAVSLTETADEVVRLLRRTIPKQISVRTGFERGLRSIDGDASQLSQAVLNLCINAVDAMDGRGVLTLTTENVDIGPHDPEVRLGLAVGPHVRLRVGDTGTGMTEEVLKRACEPFFTTKELGAGTGLGLSMAYGAARHHEGLLTLESRVGEGTTVTITLPAAAVEGGVAPEVSAPRVEAASGTVLLVDDESMLRRSGEKMLRRLGYDVLLAEDGAMALDVYEQHQGAIEVVVLDVAMPVMDGIECLERLREMNPRVRVLLCSGFPSGHQVEDALDRPGVRFLGKPFEHWRFAEAIAKLLAEE